MKLNGGLHQAFLIHFWNPKFFLQLSMSPTRNVKMGFSTYSSFPGQKNAPPLFPSGTQCLRGMGIYAWVHLQTLLEKCYQRPLESKWTCKWREGSTHYSAVLWKSSGWPERWHLLTVLHSLPLDDFMPLLWVLWIWYTGEIPGLSSLGTLFILRNSAF